MGVLDDGMETAWVAPFTGRSATLQPAWGTPVAVAVHIDRYRSRRDKGGTGEDQILRHFVITKAVIGQNDLFWMPGTVAPLTIKNALRVKEVTQVPVGASAGPGGATDHYEAMVAPA